MTESPNPPSIPPLSRIDISKDPRGAVTLSYSFHFTHEQLRSIPVGKYAIYRSRPAEPRTSWNLLEYLYHRSAAIRESVSAAVEEDPQKYLRSKT